MMREVGLDEYKDIILNVLVKVDMICRQNGLKYSLFYGTLLGAIRHKGYIPWDDDIDIIMPIEDYDRLARIIKEGEYGINFIRPEEDLDTCFAFGKICDTSTTITEGYLGPINGYGAYIDVFPFYKIPKDKKWNNPFKWSLLRRLASYAKLTKYRKSDNRKKNIARLLEFKFSRLFNPRKLAMITMNDGRRINNLVNQKNCEYLYGVLDDSDRFPRDIFENQQEVSFEGYSMLGTNNPHRNLTIRFGNYMKLPPKNQRITHHNIVCYIDD